MQMGTHLKVLSEIYPINTKWWDLDVFQKNLRLSTLAESPHLSIGRVDMFVSEPWQQVSWEGIMVERTPVPNFCLYGAQFIIKTSSNLATFLPKKFTS